MIINGSDISPQGRYIHIGGQRQELILENYLLVCNWGADVTPFALYTEGELRRIHRGFGHPPIRSTHILLKGVHEGKLRPTIVAELTKIADDCKICSFNTSAPRRFKITIGTGDLRFNH